YGEVFLLSWRSAFQKPTQCSAPHAAILGGVAFQIQWPCIGKQTLRCLVNLILRFRVTQRPQYAFIYLFKAFCHVLAPGVDDSDICRFAQKRWHLNARLLWGRFSDRLIDHFLAVLFELHFDLTSRDDRIMEAINSCQEFQTSIISEPVEIQQDVRVYENERRIVPPV